MLYAHKKHVPSHRHCNPIHPGAAASNETKVHLRCNTHACWGQTAKLCQQAKVKIFSSKNAPDDDRSFSDNLTFRMGFRGNTCVVFKATPRHCLPMAHFSQEAFIQVACTLLTLLLGKGGCNLSLRQPQQKMYCGCSQREHTLKTRRVKKTEKFIGGSLFLRKG